MKTNTNSQMSTSNQTNTDVRQPRSQFQGQNTPEMKSPGDMNSFTESPPLSGQKAFIGIDNGFTGAIACLRPDGNIVCHPVAVTDLGKERLLDRDANRNLLHQMFAFAGVQPQNILVVYEQCQPNPLFGSKNNFTNGKNGEFWRLLLSFEEVPFRWVNPQQWQRWIFRGIRGKKTKPMADLVRRQRFPSLDLDGYNATQMEGVNDAICLALFASELSAWSAQTPPLGIIGKKTPGSPGVTLADGQEKMSPALVLLSKSEPGDKVSRAA
jgi:hypothetical protein